MNAHAPNRTWSAAYAESDGDHERHVADYGGQKPMTDDDHEEILQALMNTTIRAQKAEATIARHEDTIAGLRAFPAIAERDAAIAAKEKAEAERDKLLNDVLTSHAQWCDVMAERAAATARADALAGEVEQMKAALMPFAKLANEIDSLCRITPEAPAPENWSKACQYEDLTRARAALNGAKTDGK